MMYGRISSPFLNDFKKLETILGQELLRATHLAVNLEFVWWFSPEGHPGFVEWLPRTTNLASMWWFSHGGHLDLVFMVFKIFLND
jgi:hypothetical protein